jgi:hypothetical protein
MRYIENTLSQPPILSHSIGAYTEQFVAEIKEKCHY